MKLLSIRPLLLLIAVSLIAASCDIDAGSDTEGAPTAVVITSTPTEPDGDGSTATPVESEPTTTRPEDPEPSATESEQSASPTAADGDEDPTATATVAPDTNDSARDEIESIEANVAELRGLDVLEELDVQIIDRQELARRVETILQEDYSPDEARVDTLTYWLLRLIPDESLDLYQLQVDLLSEQIAGYYDPETGELVVVTQDGNLSVTDKVTMAHEIVHALQDQHFDLVAIDELATDADHSAAITALIEGDATLAMTEYMFGYLDPMEIAALITESFTAGNSEILDNAPTYISEGLLFSYEAGQAFATELYNVDGFASINEAFEDPPASTEQILHPEKYLDAERDNPIVVDNPDVSSDLGEGWELLRGDVLGEWDLRIMLEDNGINRQDAAQAAAGWGGSWFDIYESDSGAVALLTTRWDTDEDASEFANALLASFESQPSDGGVWSESGREFTVVTGGDTVVMISGTDRGAVETILAIIEQTV